MGSKFSDQETAYDKETIQEALKTLLKWRQKLDQSPFTYNDFRKWAKETYDKPFGINKTDWSNFETFVQRSQNLKWVYLSGSHTQNIGEEKKKELIQECNKYVPAALKSIEALQSFLEGKGKQTVLNQKLVHKIPKSFFELYFFYTNKDKKGIGRAALSIDNEVVVLKNVPDGHSKNYTGKIVPSWNPKIFSANLVDEKSHKQINIKLFSFDLLHDEIILGQYLGAEDFHIESGSIVLRRVFVNSLEDISVEYFYHNHHREQYYDIPEQIVSYLQLKWLNYHKTPNSVFNLEALGQHLESYSENWGARSLVPHKVQVFFAIPNTAISDDEFTKTKPIVDSIIDNIKSEYGEKAEFNKIISRSKSFNDMHSIPPSLTGLTRCNLFVWFHMGSELASFSTVQMGISFSYCQHAIIVYKMGTLSRGIQRLRNLKNITFIPVENLTELMSEEIRMLIEEKIDLLLEN